MKPIPKYRVRLAFDFYRVGQVLQPTGLWRDHLLGNGFIEPITEQAEPDVLPVAEAATEIDTKPTRSRRHRHGNGAAL